MAISECPGCTFHIPLPPNLEEGDVMECPDCGAMVKLKSMNPPIFELVKED
ncbi:TPA: lysine biosynthesis protein LysW [Candidatus Micrarchaeota archaeon]|nr:lysine biosynthesis protein LysW [Candidatus Micrarchaeota archaeon]HIH29789.1 lysine biosynthesis protein LysW [Candidatus Micrarchaeota archaeon]